MECRPGGRFRINVDGISSSSSEEDYFNPVPLNVIPPEGFVEKEDDVGGVVDHGFLLEQTEKGGSEGLTFQTGRETKRGFSDLGTMPPRKVVLNPADYPLPPNHADYPWVDVEVIGSRSVLDSSECLDSVRQLILPCPVESVPRTYVVRPCSADERTCMTVEEGFYMCDEVISSLGVRLPFTKFETQLLRHLRLAPSQLHPNAWSFARAFQRYCQAKGLSATVRSFLYVFRPSVTKGTTGKMWVSVTTRQYYGLFSKYCDSWKYFKRRFFKYQYIGRGLPWFKSPTGEPLFPLSWSEAFFTRFSKVKFYVPDLNTLNAAEKHTVNHIWKELEKREGLQLDVRFFLHVPDDRVATAIGNECFVL